MNFSDELKKYINILSCSSKELAKKAELSTAIISRYLNGKRKPKINSVYLDQLIDAIYNLAIEKNIKISKDEISNSLKKSLIKKDDEFFIFIDNFNILQNELKISTIELSKAICYDASFLSRIKNKERKPSDTSGFIDKVVNYIISFCQNLKTKELIASFLTGDINQINNKEIFKKILKNWLFSIHKKNETSIEGFLQKIDNFDLKDYTNVNLEKIKIPTTPIILKSCKTFFGVEGRKKCEGEFLKTTLLSKSKEDIFFYSDLPMSKTAEDENFKNKWILAITMLLKRGLHLNIIHNLDRPLNELFLGLESWIPIYMTGSISPYYFKEKPSKLFFSSHATSGSVSMSCESINENKSMFYLTTKKEELKFAKEKSKYMMSIATPLMKIFKEENYTEFIEFENKENIKNLKVLKKDTFKNIEFVIKENKWVMISKTNSPKIHFVIYNKKLMDAIKKFLNESQD